MTKLTKEEREEQEGNQGRYKAPDRIKFPELDYEPPIPSNADLIINIIFLVIVVVISIILYKFVF